MREVLDELRAATARGPIAVARIIAAHGSSPRPVGATMALASDDTVIGSVSSGCVEAAVLATARDVLATGVAVVARYGPTGADDPHGTDPLGLEARLTCGGAIEVLVERVLDVSVLHDLARRLAAGEPCALLTTLGDDTRRTVLAMAGATDTPWDRFDADARAMITAGSSGVVGGEIAGDRAPVFVHTFAARPRMVLVGANDFVRALAEVAALLGYAVTVVDARATFAVAHRFPAAHEVVVDRPDRYLRAEFAAGRLDRRTVVCVMTHDDTFDVPAIAAALTLDHLAFVGALGSRRTHTDRLARLVAAGVPARALRRLHGPVGLDLGAHTPHETAVSIAAAIVAARTGATGLPLAELNGPIHR
ncbi:XdhC family protein [Williamsia sp. MIQD14]|uniref:XdhC family protein n=1 Tax=Williamsia sp. MIQD14 TaxID=3425703 RepID=UPI003D9FFF93